MADRLRRFDRTATHVRWFPNGARIEYRPGKHGGWASRAYYLGANNRMRADNWIYFGPELPKEATKILSSQRG